MSPSGVAALAAGAIAGVLCALVAAGFLARARLRQRLQADRCAEINDGASLRSFLRPYRAPLGLASLLAVSRALFDLARPWPLKFAVDSAISRHPLPLALRWLGGLSPAGLAAVAAIASVMIIAAPPFARSP